MPFLRRLDVHVLDADRAAVGVAQHTQDIAQRSMKDGPEPACRELPVEVPKRQAVRSDVEVRVRRWEYSSGSMSAIR